MIYTHKNKLIFKIRATYTVPL